jgi:hypothetical protein
VTIAFLRHARLAAKNLRLEKLPLLVTPHPLNDLTLEQVQALARSAYPTIIAQLTAAGAIPEETRIDFVHPAERAESAGGNKA